MFDPTILWEWLTLGFRWLHVVTAIAWIGSSFYFIALDLGLRQTPSLPELAHGEEWQVHGGGFYHVNKYLVAPAQLPEHLTWFKWESYSTWLTGFAMMVLVYYAGADIYLIDLGVLPMSSWVAIAISMASIGLGWVVYDLLCHAPIGKSTNGLMLVLFGILVAMAWGYTQVFTGRAAMLHMGAFTATIMSANVFFIIIPNQKKVVAALKAGDTPDPILGIEAKQRSLHNNYLTLPVIFFMLSTHYPLVFATTYNWLIAALVFLIGVVVRHYFNTRHARKGRPNWTWGVAAFLFGMIVWLSTADMAPAAGSGTATSTAAHLTPFLTAAGFEEARDTIYGRCAMCHTEEPGWAGIARAPKNIWLDSDEAIATQARAIVLQAGYSHAMPPGNVTFMEEEERALIVTWYRQAIKNGGWPL